MLCSKCGAEIPAQARFCGKCGTPVISPGPATPISADDKKTPATKKKGWLTPPIIFAGIAVIILGIGGLFVIAYVANSSKPATDESDDSSPANTTMPNVGVPPSPSKFGGYNNAMNTANAAAPARLTPGTDAFYQDKVVGVWRARKFVMGAYVDARCNYMTGGRASWSGTLTYQGRQTFLQYSGEWDVQNGMLRTRIDSSNLPQLIPVGATGASRFISIDNQQWIYMDLSDGQTSTAVRIE